MRGTCAHYVAHVIERRNELYLYVQHNIMDYNSQINNSEPHPDDFFAKDFRVRTFQLLCNDEESLFSVTCCQLIDEHGKCDST
jgi:hypothetical protein